ncbi:VIT-domain-containing protein [Mytilinidion resinicola]|uniref:VIT-domain-containing protein n=1 Tax=Mytilinidion resinicola TaxID=574789 RepID=A0A6A6YAQ5_9PEZI|nr:VIT-domain-containing protein [Mytilinidion resinicola]KAF2805583.1 VIT-domain-containing protein [Mytilinidion resinicola]
MAYYPNPFGVPYMNQFHREHAALERLASGVVFDPAHVAAANVPHPPKRRRQYDVERDTEFPVFRASASTNNVNTPELRCLPLLDVSVDVEVTSTISRTTLTQTFSNFSASLITEANYTFPLYDGAAITSFRFSVGHEKILEGRIKPKREARAEYKQAVAEQRVAALLEEHTPEVFETQLGNVPAKSTVKVEIQYVNELKADIGGEGVLVTIPTSVAPRYGSPPSGFPSSTTALGNASNHGLSIAVNVTSLAPIRKLESRTHPISVEMGASATHNNPIPTPTFSNFVKAASSVECPQTPIFDPNRAIALLSDSSATLGKDFVLLILSSGSTLIKSRAVKEAPIDDTNESAIMVTLRPQDLFVSKFTSETSNRFEGEIIFVADRSGSMMGEKINTLREALGVFLKSLPEKAFFNIYSFGDSFSSLWDSSQEYTQQSLDAAMHHISNGFDANMGGTEMFSAIVRAFQRRIVQKNFTTQIIILTDGEVWGTEQLLDFVAGSRQRSKGAVRFFSLGIGDSVSHQLIEGISRQGGGYAEVVAADGKGKWAARVIHMLKGALMPATWDCEIEIDGLAATSPQQQNFSLSPQRPRYIQAPYHIPSLHTFARQSVFVLYPQQAIGDPRTVIIRATAASGEIITTHLDIEQIPIGTNAIHHLAAKASISDLEAATFPLPLNAKHGRSYDDGPKFSRSQDFLFTAC